ncbi:MAG: hypothetical protein DWI22_05845 [Planctomycetota bacterium]|nr:MAG: hypothetical protein DWI22_05845 [Planctomycetota bacterium]
MKRFEGAVADFGGVSYAAFQSVFQRSLDRIEQKRGKANLAAWLIRRQSLRNVLLPRCCQASLCEETNGQKCLFEVSKGTATKFSAARFNRNTVVIASFLEPPDRASGLLPNFGCRGIAIDGFEWQRDGSRAVEGIGD